jgi:ribose transport system substrate-binding protein
MTKWLCSALLLWASSVFATEWPQRVGISISSLENPYFVALTRGAQISAKQLNPQVKLMVRSADYDVNRQIEHINELVKLDIDLLLVSASSEQGLSKVLRHARQKGIIVIAVDVRADGADYTVLTNNFQAGQLVCDYLARSINGKGVVAIQTGPKVSSVIDRIAGCKQAWQHYPGLRLLDEQEDGEGSIWGGFNAMQQTLKTNKNLAAIFTINDRQALGSWQALQKAGQTSIKIGSVDGSLPVVKAIASGSGIIVTASQAPEIMGRRAVELGWQLHQKQKPNNELELLNTSLVTKDNAAEAKTWDAGKP